MNTGAGPSTIGPALLLRSIPLRLVRKARAAAGGLVFLVVAPGVVAGLVPWLLTGWHLRGPLPYWLPLWIGGLILVAAGVLVLVQAFARFVAEGLGKRDAAPGSRRALPVCKESQCLAVAAIIVGQALALGELILLPYAGPFAVAVASFVRWYEEPTLRRQFREHYETYRRAVPAWWPRHEPWDTGRHRPSLTGWAWVGRIR